MAENRTPTYEEIISFQFVNMVLHTSNMAMMFLGKLAHPETGKSMLDLEAARMFIDQLEMLHVKTKGNLSPDEQKMLNDSLTSLRMMFVDTANSEIKKAQSQPPEQVTAPAQAAPETSPAAPESGSAGDAETRKKFVKKY